MRNHGKYLHKDVVNHWTKRISDKTGIDFSPHALRRTYGQMLLDKGATIETVSKMLGHASTLTTEKHYCRKNDDIARLEVLKAFKSGPSSPGNSSRLTPRNELPGYV